MKRLFSKAALGGWVLLVLSQLRWLYTLVDAWSNVEFIRDKVKSMPPLAVPIGLLASGWFQVTLIAVGLTWIALATSARFRRLSWSAFRRRSTTGEREEEVVYTIQRSFADQIADLHRERRSEPFLLIQHDLGTRPYTRREVDNLTPTQRERLFSADPAMPDWWRGKHLQSGAWPLFRVKGGIWISKDQINQTPAAHHREIFDGIPGLLDWYMKGREF